MKALEQQLEEYVTKCANLQREVEEMTAMAEEREQELENLEAEREREIDLKDGRSYKPEVVEAVWDLLEDNVAHGRVGHVIEKVLRIANKKPKQILTRKVVADMDLSRLAAGQKQMSVRVDGACC